jgi:hypothetical protein
LHGTGGAAITSSIRFDVFDGVEDETFYLWCNFRAFSSIGHISVIDTWRVGESYEEIRPCRILFVDSCQRSCAESSSCV